MKLSTIVGVYLENHPNPSMLPNNPLCLCLEHQDTEVAASPFRFPINAIQAYHVKAHCAICGEYLGLLEDQAPQMRPAVVDNLPRERVAVLPAYEMRALVAVLKKSADHFGRHICDDIDLTPLIPDVEQRREMLKRFHAWNGDPEVYEEDQAAGGWYAEYHVWSYGLMLDYFAYRLAPDIEQELREAGIRED